MISDPIELLAALARLPAAGALATRLAEWPEDVYVVGGAVRDLMLGGAPADLDLMVAGDVGPLADALGGALARHDRFGTAELELDGHRYDLARARRETYAQPGALPSVTPAAVEADLARRDFTVNAIALALAGPGRGRRVAFGSAVEDVAGGRLRVLHDESFRDDPTRLLRLARYAARLGFTPDPHTEALAEAALAAGALGTVTGSRLGHELRMLAAEPDPVAAFTALHQLGADTALEPGFGLADPGLAERALTLLPDDGDPAAVVLGAALAGLHAGARSSLLGRLAFPAAARDRIFEAAAGPEHAHQLARAGRASELAAVIGTTGPAAVALAGAAGAEGGARRWLEELRGVRLGITGTDLIAAGVAPGPAIGRGLGAALAARLDGEADDREAQLAIALRSAGKPGPQND